MTITLISAHEPIPAAVTERFDGPRLVVYLEDRGFRLMEPYVSAGSAKRVRDWRKGQTAELAQVDELLTRLDLHVDLLPDDLWIEGGNR